MDLNTGVLLLAHGSKRAEANEEWEKIWQLFAQRHPNLVISGGFIEFASPSLEEGVAGLIGQGAEKIYVVPLFLTVGNHLRQTIPGRLQQLQQQYGMVKLEMTQHIGVDPLLVDIIEQRLLDGGMGF